MLEASASLEIARSKKALKMSYLQIENKESKNTSWIFFHIVPK